MSRSPRSSLGVEMRIPETSSVVLKLALAWVLLSLMGCAPTQPGANASRTAGGVERTGDPAPAKPKVLRVAVTGDSSVLHERLKPVNDNPVGAYVNAGLTH